jgi:hypothetical protein
MGVAGCPVGFQTGAVVEKGAVGFQKGRVGFLGRGLVAIGGVNVAVELAEGGGDADMATNVVEAKDDGGRSADVATGVVDVDDDGGNGADVAAETRGERTMMGASVTWNVLGLRIDG